MRLDHVTFACDSLAQAQRYCVERFGTELPLGGEHPLMGTHNLLTKLSPHTFLEFIAINPAAPAIQRPRWFNLDGLNADGALRDQPQFIGWVASVGQLPSAQISPFGAAQALNLQRGLLHWRMGVPEDGSLPCGGLAPTLIEWAEGSPVGAMGDVGIGLEALEIHHPLAHEWAAWCDTQGWNAHDAQASDNKKVLWQTAKAPRLSLRLRSPKGLHEWAYRTAHELPTHRRRELRTISAPCPA